MRTAHQARAEAEGGARGDRGETLRRLFRSCRLALSCVLLVAACDTVDIGTPPADVNACRPSQRFFYERIWPEFLGKDHGGKRCGDAAPCHAAGSARQLRLPEPTSAPGLPLPPDWALVYKAATELMSCTNASASKLIDRPTSPSHFGGQVIAPGGPEVALVLMWVEAPP